MAPPEPGAPVGCRTGGIGCCLQTKRNDKLRLSIDKEKESAHKCELIRYASSLPTVCSGVSTVHLYSSSLTTEVV